MKVSIGIPFYNPGEVFRDAIHSVLSQSFKDFELILLDDGSSDNSLSIAESFEDERIRVISDGKNLGLPARLNQLITLSQGEFIARMDADDLINKDKILAQIQLMELHPEIDLVSTGICSITNNNDVIGYRTPSMTIAKDLKTVDVIFGKSEITHATILVRKSWYLRNKYNEKARLMEDYQLWVDAAIKDDLKVAYIPSPLYFYREESSVTLKKAIKAYVNVLKIVMQRYFKYLSFSEKLKIVTLTFAKISFVSIANIAQCSDKLLALRNKSTDQKPELLKELQEEVNSLLFENVRN